MESRTFPARMPCCAMRAVEGHPQSARLEEVALSLVGVRFRPQGRDRSGCDCLGLAVQVAQGAGLAVNVPPLSMRGHELDQALALLWRMGCRRVELARPGDLLVRIPAMLQLHLAIRVDGGLVEAHAGLRRVVLRPIGSEEQWHSAWRFPLSGEG